MNISTFNKKIKHKKLLVLMIRILKALKQAARHGKL